MEDELTKHFVIKLSCRVLSRFETGKHALYLHAQKATQMRKLRKAKNNLRDLFHPPFSWLQKMMRTLIYENQFKSTSVFVDDNPDNQYTNYPNIFFQNYHQGTEFDLMHNIPTSTINSNTMKNVASQNNILNNQIDSLSCRTTALVESNNFNDISSSNTYHESKQLYEQLTKQMYTSNQTMKYKHYGTLPTYNSTLSNTFHSNGYIFTSPKSMPTIETLPIFNQSKLYNLQNDSTKYFTYDGQHRKFYLMARYLRSAQRQRRHKRRVQKRLQEQELSEKKKLENEKLYGTLFSHQSHQTLDDKRKNIHKVKSLTSISDDKASTGSTVLSGPGMEDYNNGRIRLLCWKDIDIDLEVRSIDENDDICGLKNIENTKDCNTTTTVDGTTVIVNMNVSEPISHMNKKCSTKSSMSKIKCNQNRCKTHNSKSHINLEHSAQNDLSLVQTMTEPKDATPKYCAMLNKNAILSSHPQSPLKVECSSSKPFHKLLTHSISTSDTEKLYDFKTLPNSIRPDPAAIHMSYHQIPMNKLTVSKSGLSSLPIHNSLQQRQTSQIPNTIANRTKIPPKLNQNLSYFPTATSPNLLSNSFHYSQPNQCSTMSFLPEYHSLQPDSFQRLLQSTVIPNPFATCEDVSRDIKPEQLGRSRLSLASSRGDLDSEIVVQLSYYSQRGSRKSEDLSFFSYRDGFSAEEDVSKVTVPISLSLVIMTTYILIGAIVFSIWQDPDYLKWSYFCFITLSTIGFGDIVPARPPWKTWKHWTAVSSYYGTPQQCASTNPLSRDSNPGPTSFEPEPLTESTNKLFCVHFDSLSYILCTKIDSTNPKEKMIIICLYVAIGLSVFAMCFKLMQEEVVDKMKWFALRVGILKRKETTDTTDRSLYPMSRL
ncbi:twik family of potassium channels-related [Schistosoma mansoni]|uniref:twik family of potassium channels-related n=1 Tax=Schistosoma mansoni TaxID=6183 RepID=UPI00022DC611|nr:twik family of potassium channels-related [Schistosoma mansoni]|eukprot:XP_018650296.1 twik family of potassium channels-related [Schistosoma mansoni]